MAALFMDLLVALTCEYLIVFKTMLFICAWVLTELLPHPVYVWKQMSPLSIPGEKSLHSSFAYTAVFNSKFYSVFERKPTQLLRLAIRISADLQRFVSKSDVITSSIPITLPWLLTRPAVNFTLHCSDKSNTGNIQTSFL